MRRIKDDAGNLIYNKQDKIYLELPAKQQRKMIAKIDEKNNALRMYRAYDKHVLWKAMSYGFNYELLLATKFSDIIIDTDEKEEFRVPVKVLLDKGDFLWFKQKGFERQIFVELDIIKTYIK